MIGLLTKCEVKMAGYWVFMDRDEVKVHKRAKKNLHPATLTEKAWSIKDLLFHFRRNFSRGTQQVIHLACSVNQSQSRINQSLL